VKTLSIDSGDLTVTQLLAEAARGDVVFLTEGGETRFALVAADEGDREVFALRSNAEFLADLTAFEQRARTRPRRTLEEVRARFGEPEPPQAPRHEPT
jgi:antitoxin (DNA-binding transcriptional repressor) of toxin-antitoxin stability system